MPSVIRAATRGSVLARWQTDHVAALLRAVDPDVEVEVVVVETLGDRRQDIPIWEMGGKGVFAKEVQAAVLDGRADIAVHSAKDLPSGSPDGLRIATVPERGDPRDVLVGSTLAGLAPGAMVATGSARRRAQLAWARPDLTFTGLRGNIDTRLAKAPPVRRHRDGAGAPGAPRSARPRGRDPGAGHDGPAGGAGNAGRRVPHAVTARATRSCARCWPASSTAPAGWRWTPSGASWPSWAATATSPPGPSPRWARAVAVIDRGDAGLARRPHRDPSRRRVGAGCEAERLRSSRWPGPCSTTPVVPPSSTADQALRGHGRGRRQRFLELGPGRRAGIALIRGLPVDAPGGRRTASDEHAGIGAVCHPPGPTCPRRSGDTPLPGAESGAWVDAVTPTRGEEVVEGESSAIGGRQAGDVEQGVDRRQDAEPFHHRHDGGRSEVPPGRQLLTYQLPIFTVER